MGTRKTRLCTTGANAPEGKQDADCSVSNGVFSLLLLMLRYQVTCHTSHVTRHTSHIARMRDMLRRISQQNRQTPVNLQQTSTGPPAPSPELVRRFLL
jgi:hypothetical protein